MNRTARIVALVALGTCACIIPDREIGFEGGPRNANAVRIIERAVLSPDMVEICNLERRIADLTFCPNVRQSLPSGLVLSDDGPFCLCDSGEDNRAVGVFTIFAEDADLIGDRPADRIYGVFLLDPDPLDDDPRDAVAFERYWPACQVGATVEREDASAAGGRTAEPEARDPAPQWRFRIDDGSGVVDLCNGNSSAIEPGLHNLQFMVTDRPFFEAPFSGEAPIDGGVLHCGVPDTSIGATYAVVNYIFECIDASDEEDPRSEQCDCAQ